MAATENEVNAVGPPENTNWQNFFFPLQIPYRLHPYNFAILHRQQREVIPPNKEKKHHKSNIFFTPKYYFITPITKIRSMFSKLKINFTVLTIAVAISTIAISAPLTNMFGKHYNRNNDYSCCKNNQMVIHHYYTTRAFWITLGNGYELEAVGQPSEGCNVACDE